MICFLCAANLSQSRPAWYKPLLSNRLRFSGRLNGLRMAGLLVVATLALQSHPATAQSPAPVMAPVTAPAPATAAPVVQADPPAAVAAVLARKATNNALFDALNKDDLPKLEAMFQEQPELLKARTYWGNGLLQSALAQGSRGTPVVDLLLKKGADVNETDGCNTRPLDSAVASGSAPLVRLMLEKGAKVNSGATPVLFRSYNLSVEILQMLLTAGADINARNAQGQTPLHLVSTMSDIDKWKWMIEKGADLNARDNAGEPPFFRLTFTVSSTDIYRTAMDNLLAHGADLKLCSNDGNTLLHRAILDYGVSSSVNRIAVLLEKGIDPNAVNRRGDTALHMALRTESPSDKVLGLLISKSDLAARDQRGLTPLMLAILGRNVVARDAIVALRKPANEVEQLFNAACQNDGATLKSLLDASPRLAQLRLPDGSTALHAAAAWAAPDAVQTLTEAGAEVNARDARAQTPLHYAIRWHNNPFRQSNALQTVKMLLRRGANSGALDEDDATPLHLAAHLALVEEGTVLTMDMVDHGIEVDGENKAGKVPLDLVFEARSRPKEGALLARLLLEKGRAERLSGPHGTAILMSAVRANNTETMTELFRKGVKAPPEGLDVSILNQAVSNHAREALVLLLDQGVPLNDPARTDSPLERAIWYDYDEIARLLIERGIDVNERCKGLHTPLTQAVQRNKTELIKLLLAKKADPNLPNRDGQKPMDLAAEYHRDVIVELLRQNGAK